MKQPMDTAIHEKDLVKPKLNECPKGGKHEFEMRQGGLGQSYCACVKCGCPPPFTEHLGAH